MGISLDEYVSGYANDWSFEYSRALLAAGHQPTIVVVSKSLPAIWRTRSGAAPGVDLLFVPAGRTARALPDRFRRSEAGRFAYSIAYSLRLPAALAEFDAVYIQEYVDGRCAYLLRKLPTTIPVVAGHHGALLTGLSAAALRKVTASGERRVVFTAQLPAECERLRAALPGRRVVEVPNSFDETVFRLAPAPRPRSGLIWVGRFFEQQKSFCSLLEALALVAPGEWAPLTVVGQGSDGELFHRRAAELGLTEHIRWEGFVSDRERLADLLRSARLFVTTSRHEAFPLTVLEALACGTPAVVSDIEAHRAIRSGGLAYFPWNDPPALATALQDAFARADELERQIVAGRAEFERRYSTRALGETLDRLLR